MDGWMDGWTDVCMYVCIWVSQRSPALNFVLLALWIRPPWMSCTSPAGRGEDEAYICVHIVVVFRASDASRGIITRRDAPQLQHRASVQF